LPARPRRGGFRLREGSGRPLGRVSSHGRLWPALVPGFVSGEARAGPWAGFRLRGGSGRPLCRVSSQGRLGPALGRVSSQGRLGTALGPGFVSGEARACPWAGFRLRGGSGRLRGQGNGPCLASLAEGGAAEEDVPGVRHQRSGSRTGRPHAGEGVFLATSTVGAINSYLRMTNSENFLQSAG
jgi:hypothetical protein